ALPQKRRKRKMKAKLAVLMIICASLAGAADDPAREKARSLYQQSAESAKAGDLQAALKLADASAKADADYFYAHIARGTYLEQLGRTAEALSEYNRAVQLKPDEARGYFSRAHLLLLTGKKEEARANANQGIVLSPDSAEGYFLRAAISLSDFDLVQS